MHKLEELFENVKYFSSTTDLWTRSNRSYIAVSVHYFMTEDSSELKTSLIPCERFLGNHNHVTISQKLKKIYERFEILQKICAITTDNEGAYKLALKQYGDNYISYESYLQEREEDEPLWLNIDEGLSNSGDLDSESDSYHEGFEFLSSDEFVSSNSNIMPLSLNSRH